ncbi:uncharacterized protein METZ01_LOCUS30241 [marine metagenome]|uniref:Uncharacterized protein n=1 Tax=marine metagenome TaxID=408172 RepID=A0A381QH41_9ZZZZ
MLTHDAHKPCKTLNPPLPKIEEKATRNVFITARRSISPYCKDVTRRPLWRGALYTIIPVHQPEL